MAVLWECRWKPLSNFELNTLLKNFTTSSQGATTFSKLGVQFLGLWYYCPSTEKLDRSTQFGAVGYIIKLYSSKSYLKS